MLFLAIETAPIIAKLLAPKGEYDYKFEEGESVVATWVKQKVAQRKLLLSTDSVMNQEIYEDIKSEEELYRQFCESGLPPQFGQRRDHQTLVSFITKN